MPTLTNRFRRGAAGLGAALLLASGAGVLAAPAGATSKVAAAATIAESPMCPAAAGNARFVRYVYMMILFRCPDAAGAAYWTAQLDNHDNHYYDGLSRSQFALLLDMSTENIIKNNVIPLYGTWLVHTPTAAESAAAAASIRATKSDAQLIAHIASSDGVYARLEGDQDWLNAVFNQILDRDPDLGAKTYYAGILGTQSTVATRLQVALMLEHSAENAADWSGAAIGAAFNRQPDSGGIAYWSNWLRTSGNWETFRMWTLILSSPEGYALAQTQPNPQGEPAAPLAMR